MLTRRSLELELELALAGVEEEEEEEEAVVEGGWTQLADLELAVAQGARELAVD